MFIRTFKSSIYQLFRYREMKMRTALVDGDERLRLLPLETQINSFDGVSLSFKIRGKWERE